jgi:hypothetical protein
VEIVAEQVFIQRGIFKPEPESLHFGDGERGSRRGCQMRGNPDAAHANQPATVSLHLAVVRQPLPNVSYYCCRAVIFGLHDAVVHPFAVSPRIGDSRFSQVGQVAGNFRLRCFQNFNQVAHADFILPDEVQKSEPRPIRESAKKQLHVEGPDGYRHERNFSTANIFVLTDVSVDKSVAFYSRLFGIEPAKVRVGYAKFDVQNPPINLSLNQADRPLGTGALSHLGIQVGSTADVLSIREHWTAAGLAPRTEMQTDCCYALQDKAWVCDPDGNEWEAFVVLKDTASNGTSCCSPTPNLTVIEPLTR